MKAILKRELRAYFTSPIGYAFLAIFLLVMNLTFYFYNVKNSFADISALFPVILLVFMVIVPILTMRQFSEEFKLRTDQMLLTSPVGVWGIVMGKFLASFAVLLLALVGTLTWPLIVTMFSTPDVASIVGNYAAITFAGAAFLSLGLFISSLTESQVVAAITTFSAFFAIFLLDTASANYISIPWVRTVVGWFSLFSRYDSFSRGVFSLADVLFYLSFCGVFLFLTTRALEKKRWS